MKKIVIMLGIPGSGKGTQAKILEKDLGFVHLSTGDLLRNLKSQDEKDIKLEAEQILEKMKKGILISDELIYKIAFPEIEKNIKEGKTVVLDGAIRNLNQVEKYKEFFKKIGIHNKDIAVIEIHISDRLSKKRLHNRAIEAKKAGKEVRKDDTKKTIKERIKKQGNKSLKPLVKFYKKDIKDNLFILKGKQSIEKIAEEIKNIVS